MRHCGVSYSMRKAVGVEIRSGLVIPQDRNDYHKGKNCKRI